MVSLANHAIFPNIGMQQFLNVSAALKAYTSISLLTNVLHAQTVKFSIMPSISALLINNVSSLANTSMKTELDVSVLTISLTLMEKNVCHALYLTIGMYLLRAVEAVQTEPSSCLTLNLVSHVLRAESWMPRLINV